MSKKTDRALVKWKTKGCLLLVPEENYTLMMDTYVIKVVKSSTNRISSPACKCDNVASLWVPQTRMPNFEWLDFVEAQTRCKITNALNGGEKSLKIENWVKYTM